jgi:hypothetical protein
VNKIIDLRNMRENHIEDIKDLQSGVNKLSSQIMEEMKKQNCSPREIFDEWLEYATKDDSRWIVHIEINGKEIWDFIDWGEPSRGRRYTANEIVDYLFEQVENSDDLTQEEAWQFCQKLMEQNIGSLVYDW